jgi:iron complex outermembrane receptor protein/vitamin B12 transporter
MRDSSSQQAALSVATLEDGPNYVLVTVDTYKKEGNDRSPGVAPGLRDPFGLPAQISRGDYDRYSFNALWRTSALNILDFMFGVDRQEEVGSLDGLLFLGTWVPTHFKIDRNTNALFVEGRSTVGPIIAQLGLRNDFTSGKSPIRHPAASLNYELPGGAGSIGTTWSSAAKLPSFYALGDPIVGNPLLKPESSRQEEIHYASPYTSAVQTQFTAFRADYRDLVDFDPGPPPRLVNRARIRSTGLEFDVTTNLTDAIQASVVGTWMSIGDPNGGPPLRYRPKLQVGFAADVRLASGWRLHGGAAYTGQRHDSAIPTGDLLLGGYSATDLALTRSFEGCDLTLALDNIFNHRIEETIGTFVNDRRLRLVVRFFH